MSAVRLDALRGLLSSGEGYDALFVTDMVNVAYLSGFTGSTAMLLVTDDENLLLTDFRYTAQARGQCPNFEIIDISQPDALDEVFTQRPTVKIIGFESLNVTVSRLEGWRKHAPQIVWSPVDGDINRLRMIKDSHEIGIIRRAIAIAEDAFALVAPLFVAGTTEGELALELEFAMRRAGASAASFDIIVASGPNGAFPHHRAGDRAFVDGDLVTVDWGARYRGYCSDITRTVVVGASPGAKQREIYEIVAAAKDLAIESIGPGKNGKDIDSIARDYIDGRGYGEYFGHSLGHSLGMDVHDGTTLSQRAGEVVLQPGMVTTVEPGIYIEGFGGVRLEEDVLVTETGCESLTIPCPKTIG